MKKTRRKRCQHRFVIFEADWVTRKVRTRCVGCKRLVRWPKAEDLVKVEVIQL